MGGQIADDCLTDAPCVSEVCGLDAGQQCAMADEEYKTVTISKYGYMSLV
jgi:hypothetical protein